MQLDPLHYIPEARKDQIRRRTVTAVHVVAVRVLADGGNHWNIYLETDEDENDDAVDEVVDCTGLDMVPGAYPGRDGYLGRLAIFEYAMSSVRRKSHRTVTLSVASHHAVGDFLDAIVTADHHLYEFTAEGRGCTGWVQDQIRLFLVEGLLQHRQEAEASVKAVDVAVNTAWEAHVSRGPWILTRGIYYLKEGD